MKIKIKSERVGESICHHLASLPISHTANGQSVGLMRYITLNVGMLVVKSQTAVCSLTSLVIHFIFYSFSQLL